MGFHRSFDLMDEVSLNNLFMNVKGDDGEIKAMESINFLLLCLVRFSSSNQT